MCDRPQRLFSGRYLVTKFRGDPISHFEIIAILILRRFDLKMFTHDFPPPNGGIEEITAGVFLCGSATDVAGLSMR